MPILQAILDEDWDKLPKYDKYASVEKEVNTLEQINQMINMILYLNNLFTTLGNVMKKNMILLKELSEDFLKFTRG